VRWVSGSRRLCSYPCTARCSRSIPESWFSGLDASESFSVNTLERYVDASYVLHGRDRCKVGMRLGGWIRLDRDFSTVESGGFGEFGGLSDARAEKVLQ